MEKRVLLAVVLSFIVLYGYQAMFPPPDPRLKPRCGSPAELRAFAVGPPG